MDSFTYLNRWVVGQRNIKAELSILLNRIKEGENFNISITAPSGWGKSHIANTMANYVGLDYCRKYFGELIFDFFMPEIRMHTLDEAHLIKSPEDLYPLMDSGKYIFIILTNEYEQLKEPFLNRTIQFQLEEYTDLDLAQLVSQQFKRKGVDFPYIFCISIANCSRGNPRVAKLIAKRLIYVYREKGFPENVDDLNKSLEIINVSKGGFTELDRRYLNFLKSAERASINTICSSINIPKYTIEKDIEPFLIKKGLIQITPRGRIILETADE